MIQKDQFGILQFIPMSLLILFLFNVSSVNAQKEEIGIGIGAVTHTGDIISTYAISNNKPALMLFYKRNFGFGSALRFSLTGNQISASDAEYGQDIFAKNRNDAMDTFIVEFAAMYEYNFLDFRNIKQRVYLSPYIVLGIGGVYINPDQNKVTDHAPLQAVFPVGGGVKYHINRKFTISAEFIFKPMLTDYLDNLTGETQKIKDYQTGGKNNNDTYYFFGIKLGYSMWKIVCPFDAY